MTFKVRKIQFTRSRPYKKNDNAHIEQKNNTHVRQILGYVRYDTPQAVAAINDLYRNELRLFQNYFQPSVKLVKKIRIGAKVRRKYDAPQTPYIGGMKSAKDTMVLCYERGLGTDVAQPLTLGAGSQPTEMLESGC